MSKPPTMTEFVALLRDAAKEQPRRVFAIDFEPAPDGSIQFILRFKDDP